MDFHVDKEEIISFANTLKFSEQGDFNFQRFFEITEDDFLNERAEYLKYVLQSDKILLNSLKNISSLCKNDKCTTCPVNKYCNFYINNCRKNKSKDIQLIDLFCGAGGLSLGFVQEGYSIVFANDIQECCIDTYAHNHPDVRRDDIILGDVKDIAEHTEKYLKGRNVDLVVGGPPCQGFSTANRQRLIDDPRNHLYKHYVSIVNNIKPYFFAMENVKGMFSVANQVKDDFKNIGYSVECKILNAKDFGVPQHRERLIYIGNRCGINNSDIFDKLEAYKNNLNSFVLSDALFGLRKLESKHEKNSTEKDSLESGFKIESFNCSQNEYLNLVNQNRTIPYICNHIARYNNSRDIEIYSRLKPGDDSNNPKIADIMPYKSRSDIFKDKYFKLDGDKICKTITAHMKFDCNMYIHPSQARGLTPREAARVQSYPDDYFFRGPFTKTYMQIGNSVPPLLGRAIAKTLKGFINEVK